MIPGAVPLLAGLVALLSPNPPPIQAPDCESWSFLNGVTVTHITDTCFGIDDTAPLIPFNREGYVWTAKTP
jgi:hypothetical protein